MILNIDIPSTIEDAISSRDVNPDNCADDILAFDLLSHYVNSGSPAVAP